MPWTALLLTLAVAAQDFVTDGQVGVVTTDGFFLVGPDPFTSQRLAAADFGVTELQSPSVTWIPQTDDFIVTSRDVQDEGGLFRVRVGPLPAATVTDLTGTLPAGRAWDLVDSDWSVGRGELFLLDNATATAFTWDDPSATTAAALVPWGPVAEEPRSVAVHGAASPFGLVVSGRFDIRRLDETGGDKLLFDKDQAGTWDQVAANPITGEWYAMKSSTHDFGKLAGGGIGTAIIQFNVCPALQCVKPARRPVDVRWDPERRDIVVLAEDGVDSLFGGIAEGQPNHIVSFPPSSSFPPILMTPAPDSGITGTRGDIALVRTRPPDLTFRGARGEAADGTSPAMTFGGYGSEPEIGSETWVGLTGATPLAGAWLVLGLTELQGTSWWQTLWPSPDLLVPMTTDTDGAASSSFPIPFDVALLGLQVWAQWWVEDPTPGAPADLVASEGAVLTVGS